MGPVTVIHAPSPLGLAPPAPGRIPGVRFLPGALRQRGLHRALGVHSVIDVPPPPYVAERDRTSRIRNGPAIATYSSAVADAVAPQLQGDAFVLLLGGDCSIFLGAALALRRQGRHGVVYLDAHSDCQTPEVSGTGGVAGMPLAIATGRGPRALVDLEGRAPLVRDADVVLVGVRDLFDVTGGDAARVAGTAITVHDLGAVRRLGAAEVARRALARLEQGGVAGVWIHLDADVLDAAIMPAVDSPDPGGLDAAELSAILASLVASPLVRGMDVTIYDPERDPDGRAGDVLAAILTGALAPSRAAGTP